MKHNHKSLLSKCIAAVKLLERLPKVQQIQVTVALFFVSLFTGGIIGYGIQAWQVEQRARFVASMHEMEVQSIEALITQVQKE